MAGTQQLSLSNSPRLPTSDQSTQNGIGEAFSPVKRCVKNRASSSGDGVLSTIPTNNTSTLTQLSLQTNHRQCAVLPSEIWLHTLNKYYSFEELFNLSKVSKEHRANFIGLIKQRFRPSSDKELEQLYTLLLSKEAQTAYQNNPDFERLLDNGPAQWAKNCNFAEIFKLLLLRNENPISKERPLNNHSAPQVQRRVFFKFLKDHLFTKKVKTNEIKSLTREELISLKLPTLTVPVNTASTHTETTAIPSISFSKAHSEYFLTLLPLLLTQKQEPNFEVFFTQVLPEWIHEITPAEVIINQLKKNSSHSKIECLYTCNIFIDDRIYSKSYDHPMILAAYNKNLGLLKVLIDKGFNINATSCNRRVTALHDAAQYQDNIEAVTLLIDKGAKVNKRDLSKKTPLHAAAKWGCIENIKLLIQHGANVNLLDNEGLSPLHYAMLLNRVDVVKFLIKRTDPYQTSACDNEVLNYVKKQRYTEVVKIFKKNRKKPPAKTRRILEATAWAKETLTELSQIGITTSTSRPV